jgi:hypothetical protein
MEPGFSYSRRDKKSKFRAQEWAHMRLTTIGESCRVMMRETLGKTIAWVVQPMKQWQSLSAHQAH